MVQYIWEIFENNKKMGSGYIDGLMELFIMGNGKMIIWMDIVKFYMLMIKNMKDKY